MIGEKDEHIEKERGKYEDLTKEKEKSLKKLEAQKEEIQELKSELAQAKKREDENRKEKEKALKKVETQKQEIQGLESELAKLKKLEEENNKVKKSLESEVKNKKIEEIPDSFDAHVNAKESQAGDSKENADVAGESSFVKQNEKVENAVDEKSVIEKPNQEFQFERHNIDDEVEKAEKADNEEKLQNSLA